MAQLFRKGSNSLFRAGLAMAGFGVFLIWGILYAIDRSPYATEQAVPIRQVVPFSHKHHVGGLGLDCRYCHTSVEESYFAGLPPTETCMTCHSQVWTDAPLLAPVRASLASGQPLAWNRVNQLPGFAYFNHSIHVRKGVGCSTCHGPIDQMPLTYKAHSLYMRWCVDCHEAPEKQLRPRELIYQMDWVPPADQDSQGQKLLVEYGIQPSRLRQLKDCSICHR